MNISTITDFKSTLVFYFAQAIIVHFIKKKVWSYEDLRASIPSKSQNTEHLPSLPSLLLPSIRYLTSHNTLTSRRSCFPLFPSVVSVSISHRLIHFYLTQHTSTDSQHTMLTDFIHFSGSTKRFCPYPLIIWPRIDSLILLP